MNRILNAAIPAALSAVIGVATWPYVARAIESHMVNSAIERIAEVDYVEGERSTDLITPDIRSAAVSMMGERNAVSFLHALMLQMAKYDLDMQSQAGRRAWHGRLVREEIHTNELVKVEVYSNEVDGAVWRYRMAFKPKAVKGTARRTTFSTNGVPSRLAAARAARAAQIDAGTVVTNVETVANAPKGVE